MEQFSLNLLIMALLENTLITFIFFSIFIISIKQNIDKFIIISLITAILTITIRIQPVIPMVTVFIVFLLHIFFFKYFFNISVIKGAISVGLVFIIYTFLEFFLLRVTLYAFDTTPDILFASTSLRLLFFLIQGFFVILLVLGFRYSRFSKIFERLIKENIFLKSKSDLHSKHILNTLYLVTLFLVLQGFILISLNWSERIVEYFNVEFILYPKFLDNLIVMVLTIILIYLFYHLTKTFEMENKRMIEQIKKESKQKLRQELNKQLHDFKNHFGTLQIMLEMDKKDRALKYLKGIIGEIKTIHQEVNTGSESLNALLYSKLAEAKRQNINLEIKIKNSLADSKINKWDLNRIIGNLIDNSLEALKKIKGDKISEIIIAGNDREHIFEVITHNILIPDEVKENIFKEGYTTKEETGHGLGMFICKELVATHNGQIYIEKDEINNYSSFIVKLPVE